MPRPGTRQFECIKRAWHSDRHQPIRGSLIQQIFRVVVEAHAASTKTNKEWLQKLPVVVLKAEEIMYSKADSEAEYSDLDTLWDRVNNAINIIIRRDETTETGDLLPPCVEAALNLGCIPVRASRSQRNSNPRSYLTPRPEEHPTSGSRVPDTTSKERRPPFFPFHSGSHLNFSRSIPAGNSPNFHSESNHHANIRNNNLAGPCSNTFQSPENVLTGNSHLPVTTPLNQGTVYPLYYGTQFRTNNYQPGPGVPETAHSETIYVGTPVIPPNAVAEPTRLDNFTRSDTWKNPPREACCDLSLRLGLLTEPIVRGEKSFAFETNDVASSTSLELRRSTNREFCSFPGKPGSDFFEPGSRMLNSGGEGSSLEANARKGKQPLSHNHEDRQFCRQPGVPSNWFTS